MATNYSKFLSIIDGADRTVDLSLPANILELSSIQMDGSVSGNIVISASATTTDYSMIWPSAQAASSGYVLTNDGTGQLSWSAPAATGVTSVALALPVSVFNISGSPITGTGTLTGSFATQNANVVFAGPSSGSASAPTFRSLVSADLSTGIIGTTQLADTSVTAAKLGSITDGTTLDQSGAGNTLEIKAAGVSATQLATGAFDQVTISGGAGTAASVLSSPAVATSEISDQSLSASTLYALRYALASDAGPTVGRMWKADNDTTSHDNFYVIGLAYPSGSVAQGGAVKVTEYGLINVPSHGFTTGAPLFLGASGACTSTPPTASLSAVVRVGIVKDANNIWVDPQLVGIN